MFTVKRCISVLAGGLFPIRLCVGEIDPGPPPPSSMMLNIQVPLAQGLSYSLAYDIGLKRWGKIQVSHVACFDFKLPNSPKRTISYLQSDGTIMTQVWDIGNYTPQAVAMLGKFELTRQDMATLLEVDVENINTTNTNFTLKIGTSYDGKDYKLPLINPYLVDQTNQVRVYNSRTTGVNHTLVMKGAFNLVSVQVTLTNNGSR